MMAKGGVIEQSTTAVVGKKSKKVREWGRGEMKNEPENKDGTLLSYFYLQRCSL